ncbi:MAG: hypothetical protein MJD61_01640 [Proteobacteria bacterium]|nr:hypothetical protein [Pseudomonadota bacterium]
MSTDATAATRRAMAAGGLALLLGACAQVSGDARGVVIEHAANQVGAADLQAADHCARHGRKAVRVKTGPAETSVLLLRKRTSTYRCVPG